MTKKSIQDVITLIQNGWRAYDATPENSVYARLSCPYAPEKDENGRKKRRRRAPLWFVRGDSFVCVGCEKGCCLFRPEGFVLPLPVNYGKPQEPYTLTPSEMVQCKHFLRVDEAAYCLNISTRTVREWIDVGKLRRAVDPPVRVLAEDVAYHMEHVEE